MTELDSKLQELARELGADLLGVADLTPARDEILRQGGREIEGYPRAVSIGIVLFATIVDRLPKRLEERAVSVNYLHHCYDVVNSRLDLSASRIAGALQREHYRALPLPASERVDDDRICGQFSHKLAAHLAGLGWIGKSCLLVTPEAGPRVRWTTVLTDAPLEPTGEPMGERCGDCTECVDACPQEAFTGRPFIPGEPREARYDARKCERYFKVIEEKAGERVACGLCVYACPFGRR
jgi:epoxyqueuosine reductase QueG